MKMFRSLATAVLLSAGFAATATAQDIPPSLTPADVARLRALLAAQERAETMTPELIRRLREQMRTGAKKG